MIDLPADAHLPRDYVSRDDVRIEAYRRLAAVGTPADVDDIRGEWLDRYGPLPPEAEALLAGARLRAECVRIGATSVTVQKGVVRIARPRAQGVAEGAVASPGAQGRGQGAGARAPARCPAGRRRAVAARSCSAS